MSKNKQPQPPIEQLSPLAYDQTSPDLDEFGQLIEELKTYRFAEKLNQEDKATIQSLAIKLVEASMSHDDSDELEQIPTDRHTRKNLRLLTEPALAHIAHESQGDQELEQELQTSVIKSIARAGIVPTSVRLSETSTPKPAKASRETGSTDAYILTVKPADKAYLESLLEKVDSDGKWSKAATEKAAVGFLDIYYPARKKANYSNGSRQEIMNAIATANSYSHTVAMSLSKLPQIQQTSSIEDIRSEIFNQLKLRASDEKLQELLSYDDYTIPTVPEIREFNNAIKGAQFEILAHQALASFKLDSYRYSSLEEDISKGYDLVLEAEGNKYYLDVKAARNFTKSAKAYSPKSIIGNSTDRGYLVRQTRNLDQDGQAIKVIVLDIETTGAIKYQRNRLELTNPANYQATLQEAMQLVDNTNN